MDQEILHQLRASFDELESSIDAAQESLARRYPAPQALIVRIQNYKEVVLKQRRLTDQIYLQMAQKNWEEVNRTVRLINAFSNLVHEDAKEVTAILLGQEADSQEDETANRSCLQ